MDTSEYPVSIELIDLSVSNTLDIGHLMPKVPNTAQGASGDQWQPNEMESSIWKEKKKDHFQKTAS